jgi:acetyl coenzyme A synthetase (ADP forming)-like protein
MSFDALLADGTVVSVRPIESDDRERLLRFHDALSAESKRLRFFAPHPYLFDDEVTRFTTVDHHAREALVAVFDDEFIGVARYDRSPDGGDAEIAFVVSDAWQHKGVATLLLDQLATRAREEGIDRFVADTLPENRRMIDVFLASGLEPVRRFEDGVIRLTMPLTPTPAALEAVDRREHVAAARSIGRLLKPGSVAVVGASAREGAVGHELVRSVLDGGFRGPVYPIHPTATEIAGLPAYPSVVAVPDAVDLAIIAVPPSAVDAVVEDCAAKGVNGLVVVTGGFAEAGDDGRAQQRRMVETARRHGMRVIGPNCVGVVNTDDDVRLNATFGAVRPVAGRVALASQSGAVGIAVLAAATQSCLGISAFVSLGNKADVSSNDLLQWWEDDPRTAVVLLYLESFGNPTRFARLSRRIGQTKPIVAVKSGRTAAGKQAAGSHTAALAADDAAVDALFRHCGVIRVDTIDELLDVAVVLANQPVPSGRRIAVVGNSGGPGIMAADACPAAGLELAHLSTATATELAGRRSGASVLNPVDLLGDAGPDDYAAAIRSVLADPGVDAVVVIFAPTLVADADAVAAAIGDAADGTKPLAAVIVGRARGELPSGDGNAVPLFGSVEPAVAAIGHTVNYGHWRRRPIEPLQPPPGIDLSAAIAVIDRVLAASTDGRWLDPDEAQSLLDAVGIDVAPTLLAHDRAAAVAAANEFGYPVALKAWGASILHKTEINGVVLDLMSPDAVADAWDDLHTRVGDAMAGALVQAMAPSGVEVIAGSVRDPQFGPLVLFGLGGTVAELFGDRTVRVAPLSPAEAADAVRSLRATPLLTGYRGSEPVALDALEDLLVRLSWLAFDLPEVVELDLNPVIASPAGIAIVDVRVRVAPVTTTDPDADHRRLPPPRA